MIIGSMNIRGLGGRIKKKKIRTLISHNKLQFVAIQETKLESLEDGLCESLWGGDSCEWVFNPSVGRSGGMLCIWNKEIFKMQLTFKGGSFCGVCGEWGPLKIKCFMVNIYSSCILAEKKKLWDDLRMTKRGFGRGAWCLMGDFNAVKSQGERKGTACHDYSAEIQGFLQFIEDTEMIDIPIYGRKFTWYKSDGSAMSRLD